MKILLVHNYYQSKHIGGEDRVFEDEKNALIEQLGSENVLTYTVSNNQLKKWKIPFTIFHNITHFRNIRRCIRQHQIQLMHVHNFFPLLTPSVFKAAHKEGIKVVQTLHNYRWWCLNGTFFQENSQRICELCAPKKWKLPGIQNRCYRQSWLQSLLSAFAFYRYHQKKVMKWVDYYFVLSRFQMQKCIDLNISEKKLILKPNATKLFTKKHPKQGYYLYIGRLESGKGIDILLKTWEALNIPYTLKVVGEGDISSLKEKYPNDKVEFLGKQNHAEVLRLLAGAKYLLHTALYYETFGLTVIEAFSCGTPVIGFDIGTRTELIQPGYNGLICQPQKLGETIIQSYQTSDYDKLVEGALESAKQYDQKQLTTFQVQTYEKIINHEDIHHYRL